MPIRPENRARYPKDWAKVSKSVRVRSGWQCECAGECGRQHYTDGALENMARAGIEPGYRCAARQMEAHPITGSMVILTVAHLDHQPENCAPENLKAMCQRCHLAYDREHHAQTAARTRKEGKASGDLFGESA